MSQTFDDAKTLSLREIRVLKSDLEQSLANIAQDMITEFEATSGQTVSSIEILIGANIDVIVNIDQ